MLHRHYTSSTCFDPGRIGAFLIFALSFGGRFLAFAFFIALAFIALGMLQRTGNRADGGVTETVVHDEIRTNFVVQCQAWLIIENRINVQ